MFPTHNFFRENESYAAYPYYLLRLYRDLGEKCAPYSIDRYFLAALSRTF